MYLRPILRIPVHCHINRQTQIDPIITLSVPPQYGLISTYDIRRGEYLYVILIKISNNVFNEFPLMSLMDLTLTSHTWLMDPSKMPSQNIKMVPIHAVLAKIRSRPVL